MEENQKWFSSNGPQSFRTCSSACKPKPSWRGACLHWQWHCLQGRGQREDWEVEEARKRAVRYHAAIEGQRGLNLRTAHRPRPVVGGTASCHTLFGYAPQAEIVPGPCKNRQACGSSACAPLAFVSPREAPDAASRTGSVVSSPC